MTPIEHKTTALANYLFRRVSQLGVQHILGVPGDFNLFLLDYVESNPNLKWVGCCNELNAAYAADGFSRLKHVPGVLITTYGVGELSALNGIAGARAERSPILHIVGMTSRAQQSKNLLLHHVVPGGAEFEPDHMLFTQSSKPFSCATEILMEPSKAGAQIDRVIKEIVRTSSPGYIYLPTDMVHKPIPEPEGPLDLSYQSTDKDREDKVVEAVLAEIYKSSNPAILVDVLTDRFKSRELAQELINKTGFWAYSTGMGKGLVDETHPQFVGLYNGQASADGVAQAIESSDLVINVGPLLSDSNTGGFTRKIDDKNAILLHNLYCTVRGEKYEGVHFEPVLRRVVKTLDQSKVPKRVEPKPTVKPMEPEPNGKADIYHTAVVDSLSKLMKPKDSLFVESSTFQFAYQDVKAPENTSFHSQIFYSSIGFALPSILGAGLANRENNSEGRVILVEGDGSAQMTIQELGTIVRNKLNPIIFLVNNEGYSIERAIWGPEQGYNDICPKWKWTQLAEALGGTPGKDFVSYRVSTRKELDELVSGKLDADSDKCRFVEIVLNQFDYPWRLRYQVKNMGAYNMAIAKEYAKEHGEE
uniref:ARAD1B14806p n=1 Tax=Blastobotrys adeninivorans TaxID=409370 RepID=A0A060T6T9_BLAAD